MAKEYTLVAGYEDNPTNNSVTKFCQKIVHELD